MEVAKRNYGLDLLRIVSMFLVVNLHVLSQGGVMVRITGQESTYYASWFIETCAYCAVNCYGLLSGYVGVDSKFRPARLLELWCQVFFYSAGITLIFWPVSPDLLMENSLWKAIFPIGWKTYWYFSAYAGLFFVMPYLNRLVLALKEAERKRMALMMFLVFSVFTALPKVNDSDFLSLVGGYSFVWLVILYLFGACLKKCSFRRWKKWQYLLAYFGLVTFSWAFKILVENYTRKVYGEPRFGRMFTGYAAPTILLCGVCLLLIFEGIHVEKKWAQKLIAVASPLAFSVYLIHTHPLIWDNLISGLFSEYRNIKLIPLVMGAVLLSAAAIYVVCSLLDLIRFQIFRVIGVRRRSELLVDTVKKRIESRKK